MFNNIPPSGFPQIDLSQDVKRINAEISGMASDCTNILTDITAETATVSGNPISLSDALATNAISVVARIEPVQSGSGTPSPENVRPIVGMEYVNIYNNRDTIYAFHIDGSKSDPSEMITYLEDAVGKTPAGMDYTSGEFSYGGWEDAFFMPSPCMLKSDGTVDYYLDPDDYTKKEDGTASDIADTTYDGNAMMEWGSNGRKIWTKIVPDANDTASATIYIANYQADNDYHDYSFHNCNGASVSHFYTPIYNGSVIDGVMRSMSGQAVSNNLTAQEEITAAELNNPSTEKLWTTEIYSDIQLVNMLLMLIGKSTNTQSVFGEGLTTGGVEAVNDNFRTGVHNDKGLFYGTNSGAIADGSYGNAVKVFGMENWWGFQWQRYQGHVMVDGMQKVKQTYGTEDGSTETGYNLTGSGYISVGATPTGTSGQYLCEMLFSPRGILPKKADNTVGASSNYYCDGLWFNNSGTRVPLRGGDSNPGAKIGAFSANFSYAAPIAGWIIGVGLSCKPTKEINRKQKATITASLGTTIYGGSVDMTEGSASVTMANIASYNGETIGEPWLSSMDEYVSGATPTTGAQVVYTLATPTTISLTPTTLAMLDGENEVSTDAEEVNIEYIKNTLVGRVRRLEEQ